MLLTATTAWADPVGSIDYVIHITVLSHLKDEQSGEAERGDGEAAGITTTDYTDYTDKAGAWYDMQGRRVDGKPKMAGLYIHNGRKVAIK